VRTSAPIFSSFRRIVMVRRLMALAGINGGDEAVRNGAAQDDLATLPLG